MDVLVLADDLAVAPAAELPVRVHHAVLQVLLGQLLVTAHLLLLRGGGLLQRLEELAVLARQDLLDAPAHLALDALRLRGGRAQEGLGLLAVDLAAPELLAGAVVSRVRPHSARLEASPQVLVQPARLLDALALRLRPCTRHVDHDHLPVPVRGHLPEVEGEARLREVLDQLPQLEHAALGVHDSQVLFVAIHRGCARRGLPLLELPVHVFHPCLAVLDRVATLAPPLGRF
mmetsp:Transcript_20881/g.55955  ORF Transcript_20881/g.55955 Transcript_20881/m.55955 type:complete len:231 (+) Transcript_20881:2346-3038(+)